MILSYLYDERDNLPARGEGTWDELVAALAAPRECQCTVETCPVEVRKGDGCVHKSGPSWSPGFWPTGGKRGLGQLEGVSALVVDFDHLATDEALAAALAPLASYQHVVHASHSDRPGNRCVRAVVPLTEPVAAADWPRFWTMVMHGLGLPADPSCCDGSRLYYLPSRPRGASYYFRHEAHGWVLDVRAVLASADAAGLTRAAPRAADAPSPIAVDFAGAPPLDAQIAAVEALAAAWPETGRHRAQLALSGALARQGWPAELVAEFVTAVCARAAQLTGYGDVSGDYAKRLASARDSVGKYQAGIDVSGWPSLVEVLQEDLGAPAVRKACGSLGFGVVEPMPSLVATLQRAALASERARELSGVFPTAEAAAPAPPTGDAAPAFDLDRLAPRLHAAALITRPPVRILPTGFSELDVLMGGGLWTRRFYGLAAPPGSGKTAIALDRMLAMARMDGGPPGLYLSTELESDELAARAAAPTLGVPWRDLITNNRQREIAEAVADLRVHAIGCDHLPRDGAEIIALIRDAAMEVTRRYGRAPFIVVDYVQQLVRGEDPRNLRSRVGDVSSTLRQGSQFLDSAILGVLSVSRSYYGAAKAAALRVEDDPEAYMAAAKESGDVDYDCAGIMFVDVDKSPEGPIKPARIVVAKCRHGEVGYAGARFHGHTGKWVGDPTAVAELAADFKKHAKDEVKYAEDDEQILKTVQQLAAKDEVRNKNDLVQTSGINHKRAREAIDRLLARGVLDIVGSRGSRDRLGRARDAHGIVLASAPREVPAVPPINPDSLAARFVPAEKNKDAHAPT